MAITKTWTLKEIYNAIAAALLVEDCPRCPSLFDAGGNSAPSVIETCGPWTLSVARSDVMVTVPAVCHVSCHRFILVVSLWHRAKTPSGGLRLYAKNKIAMTPPARPRPLAGI